MVATVIAVFFYISAYRADISIFKIFKILDNSVARIIAFVTLGYTSGYLLTGLCAVRLCASYRAGTWIKEKGNRLKYTYLRRYSVYS
jgi:hypothetical protein